jgi:hypothetical protein
LTAVAQNGGSRYLLGMQVFIFQSNQRGDLAAFTQDWEGRNLPADGAPWNARGEADIYPGDDIAGVIGGADVVISGVEQDGIFLAAIEPGASLYPASRRGFW